MCEPQDSVLAIPPFFFMKIYRASDYLNIYLLSVPDFLN